MEELLAEYGLLGAVLGGLFTIIYSIGRQLIKAGEGLLTEHRQERLTWIHSSEQGQQKVASAVDRLSQEIRELAKEQNSKRD